MVLPLFFSSSSLSLQVSPVDGKVMHIGTLTDDYSAIEQVKGVQYSLKAFLGRGLLPRYGRSNGMVLHTAVLYLSPGDYHHFHSPADWRLHLYRHFPGTHTHTHTCMLCLIIYGHIPCIPHPCLDHNNHVISLMSLTTNLIYTFSPIKVSWWQWLHGQSNACQVCLLLTRGYYYPVSGNTGTFLSLQWVLLMLAQYTLTIIR